ncbi:MAG TPA: hypothetical protein VF203_12000 [Burkholderiales bacterium]
MRVAARLLAALAPLMLAALFGWAVLEGRLRFGGGDKDVLLIAPALLWALIHFFCYAVLWAQGFGLVRAAALAGGVATGFTAIAWVALFVFAWLVRGW